MHIKSIIIDGFKSYGKRTEINGFDPLFNAITGLNGSGKSNILDSICFVLGISNLGHVRAGSLQELVYKNGQAGVTKASVTIVFDNHNPDSCPIGYEQFEEITVTRQVVVGGKNKYLINGSNVQNKRVQDLFCSVQLNVNNPHFLIMQGRITKVLNMKPPEILSMIEEAAGTRMYESKRQAAEKTIEKKDAKLRELNDLIDNDIAPRIRKLKEEQGQYMEYQKLTRDLERVTRIYIAWQYVHSKESVDKAKTQVSQTTVKIEEMKTTIKSGEEELKDLKVAIEEIQKRKDEESGSKLKELESQLQEVEKEEAKCTSKLKATKDSIKSQMKSKIQLEKSLEDDDNTLTKKQTEMGKMEGLFQDLKEADQKDSEALVAAQEKFQAISSGLLAGPAGGEAATLQDQLMACEQEIAQAATEAKQSDMQLKHCKSQLVEKQQELKQTEKEYLKDKQILDTVQREVESLEAQLKRLDYQDGTLENLTDAKQKLTLDIRVIKERIDSYERRFPHVFFQYKDPEPNFDRSRVKGLVCMHIKVKDPAMATALQVVAGGQLYNVIVDTEVTSKLLLQKGQLLQRTTFIPLNKIASRSIDTRVIQAAQQLVGKDNVWPALSLIDYDPSLKRAMEFIFGRVFVARNMEIAKVIAFDERIKHKCVTLEGDVFDPAGVLSGGARSKSASILIQLQDLKEAQLQLQTMENNLRNFDTQIHKVKFIAEKFNRAKQDMELKKHQVDMVQQNLQQTTHHKTKEEVEALESKMSEFELKVANCKRIQSEGSHKVKQLENMVKNAKEIRERELKLAEKEMLKLKKKAEDSRAQWLKREQECEGLKLEIQELKVSISQSRKQIADMEEEVAKLSEEQKTIEEELKNIKGLVDNKLDIVKKHKEVINAHTKEIQKAISRQEEIEKTAGDLGLLIKKQEHELSKQKNDVKECQSKVAALMKSCNWIADEEQFFGHPKGAYDFNSVDVRQLGKNINHMEERKEELGRKLNLRALNMLGKEEEQYKDLLEKKRVVENDKGKIMQVMRELDDKKKKALRQAWSQVDKDFGSIFSTLLPGANACLKPPDGMDVLDGLEVKVGFGGLWKESLNELSGGQRSLVALSLILSMLLFKPAPIYILDEVDAALDLSHTQNIGTMLRTHFKQSQFIVVSLKDGMFNNANVLFRTEFIDGMSTVTRNVQKPTPSTAITKTK